MKLLSFKSYKPLTLTFTLVLLNGLFYPVILPIPFCNSISLLTHILLLIYFIKYFNRVIKVFAYVKYIIGVLIISIFTALLFHDQSIDLSIRAMYKWFDICLCFYLLKCKFSDEDVYKGISYFCFLWILLYLISVASFPHILFNSSYESSSEDYDFRGWYRIYIIGSQFNFLLFFWNLQKFILQNKKKFLVLTIIFLLAILSSLSRQHILINIVMLIFILIKDLNISRKLFFGIIMSIILFVLIPRTEVYHKMLELTENQIESTNNGKDDIRIQTYKYYFGSNNTNWERIIFGNGMSNANSSYGKEQSRIIENKNMYLSDVGIASFYIYFGLLGSAIFFYSLLNVFLIKIGKKNKFIHYYLISCILGTVFSNQLINSMSCISIILYLLFLEKQNMLTKNSRRLN